MPRSKVRASTQTRAPRKSSCYRGQLLVPWLCLYRVKVTTNVCMHLHKVTVTLTLTLTLAIYIRLPNVCIMLHKKKHSRATRWAGLTYLQHDWRGFPWHYYWLERYSDADLKPRAHEVFYSSLQASFWCGRICESYMNEIEFIFNPAYASFHLSLSLTS